MSLEPGTPEAADGEEEDNEEEAAREDAFLCFKGPQHRPLISPLRLHTVYHQEYVDQDANSAAHTWGP